jgi:hypothetical protein
MGLTQTQNGAEWRFTVTRVSTCDQNLTIQEQAYGWPVVMSFERKRRVERAAGWPS